MRINIIIYAHCYLLHYFHILNTSTSNNKLIAKNTLFLYFRMLLVMGVTLYTSRIVLSTLGIDNFGIYNLVGGVVVLFTFLSAAMTTATQRFLCISIGERIMIILNTCFHQV